jgi:hypothetical protein
MPVGVRYGYDHLLLLDDGNKVWSDDLGVFGAPAEIIGPVSLTQLRRALETHAEVWGGGEAPLWVSNDDPARFNDEESEPLPYRLVFADDELLLAIDLTQEAEFLGRQVLTERLRPVTNRWGAEVLDVIATDDDHDARRLYVRFPTLRRTGRDAFRLADELLETIRLSLEGPPDHSWVVRIVTAGLWDLLLDLDESSWLEAKREHYRSDARGQLNFASDVAGLCNSGGGVLIVGARTKRHPDGDRIVAVNRCPLPSGVVRRYEHLLRRLVFPAPRDLRVLAIQEHADRTQGLLIVDVPPQRGELMPFMVAGAVVGDTVHGAMVGIPTRTGSDTDWMHVAELHARLQRR